MEILYVKSLRFDISWNIPGIAQIYLYFDYDFFKDREKKKSRRKEGKDLSIESSGTSVL